MSGFCLLVAHLVGDYILQNDWMAANKTNPHPGSEPHPGRIWLSVSKDVNGGVMLPSQEPADIAEQRAWWNALEQWRMGHLACTTHCTLYTLCIALFSFWWMPWWGYAACFAAHWPIDRFRLARWWMMNVSGQKAFATGALSPWSIIVVDNVFHLLTLLAIATAAGVPS